MSATNSHIFQATRWSLIARATKDDAPAARAALDELCRLYWPPLFSFARRWGLSEADAEDTTQNYFAELLRNDKFAIADAERGKLRTFLLHSFTQRLKNFRERDGQRADLSLNDDETHIELADEQTPEREFNRQWAVLTMQTTLYQLESEYAASGKSTFFDACRPMLGLESGGNEDYASIALEMSMKEGAVRVAVHRLRHRYREVLFATIAETLETPSDAAIRHEVGALIEALHD